MKPATVEFLKQRFSEYYRKSRINSPSALEQREWGSIHFDPSYPEIRMRRHMGFLSSDELSEYVRTMSPAHIYYSSAYYEAPSAGTMAEKRWTGADLIFDLDADHILRGPYDLMLRRVREETEKLLRMLIDELGFSERVISVVFSGGRGYHIHVTDIAVRSWGSSERRELVDYIRGIGLHPETMLTSRGGTVQGWRMRYRETFTEYLAWIRGLQKEEALSHLMRAEGSYEKEASKLYRQICESDNTAAPQRMRVLLKSPILQNLLTTEEGEFQKRLRERAALADEPVTTDIKRLIRLPTSLHGGSGLRVTPLNVRDLPSFDPLVDAVVFGER
ncbi:MAG TPA: DNA primase catalytic subunit PriS, partial [Methanomicrobiales archaeon]|nr:DNA primase catalytic subunit PriS [Methanomicrobiales archaeon]